MKTKLENLRNLMEKYELFQQDDEVGIALKELEEVETRVYVVDTHSLRSKAHWDLSDDKFMSLAENQGTVYTLEGFKNDFNVGVFDAPHYVIRFINQPI
jgi:CRISPR/Cas system CMR-associated protein Cmr3 (group 5 of RAMP superfamily)